MGSTTRESGEASIKTPRHGWTTMRSGGYSFAFVLLSACSAQDISEQSVAQALWRQSVVAFQQGVLPTSDYDGSTDAELRQRYPTVTLGSYSQTCTATGGGSVYANDTSCVLRWDLNGAIPEGSIVGEASLTLRVLNGTTESYSLSVLNRPWEESSVSWNRASTASAWASPGALAPSDRGAVVGSVSGGVGSLSLNLSPGALEVIQGWVDGAPNYGFVLSNRSAADNLQLASSEHSTLAYRPILSVKYKYFTPDVGLAGAGGENPIQCTVAADCPSGVCTDGVCAMPSCWDGVTNGMESDEDCGGGICAPCASAKLCRVGSDCRDDVCEGGRCAVPTCTDGATNGNETDEDCGGGCKPCPDGARCLVDADCDGDFCFEEVCEW